MALLGPVLVLVLVLGAVTVPALGVPAASAAAAVRGPTLIVGATAVPGIIRADHPVVLAAQSVKETGPSGFLRGAVAVDEDLWDRDSNSPAKLGERSAWGRRIGALGIGEHTTVLVYDDGELKFASRVRFLLAHFGVGRALLVDGGWPALARLAASGRLTIQPAAATPRARPFTARVTSKPIPIVWQKEVAADRHRRGVLVVDVRTAAQYDGSVLLPPVTRGGHIPGALDMPTTTLFTPAVPGTLRGPQAQRQVLEAHGVVPSDTVVVYCQDGARSSLVASMLVQLGYPSVELYYLSYANWQSNAALQVAR